MLNGIHENDEIYIHTLVDKILEVVTLLNVTSFS